MARKRVEKKVVTIEDHLDAGHRKRLCLKEQKETWHKLIVLKKNGIRYWECTQCKFSLLGN